MKITIVDYGLGNLFSVGRALEQVGAEVEISDRAEKIARAEKLVLPGVAAFADGMRGLEDRGLLDAVVQFAGCGRPFLGKCALGRMA
jgi:glutamine amidotransferase